MKLFYISTLAVAVAVSTAQANPPAVGTVSNSQSFAVHQSDQLTNKTLASYDGSILVIMMMTPWCPGCQSNAQAVGAGILDFFDDADRQTLVGKNNRGVPIRSILLSTEEAAAWDAVNDSFASTNGYDQWGIDANAQREDPRKLLGYYRGGFIASSNLYDWGNDRRRVVVLNLVKNSASHAYREIIINQNAYSSTDNTDARSAINAIQAAETVVAPTITKNPASATIDSGDTVTLSIDVSGTNPNLQWYSGASGVTTNPVSGATSATYTTPPLTSNRHYWARASNSEGSDDSNAATITVNPLVIAPIIANAPRSSSITSGGSVTLSVFASGTSPSYQWYIGNSGVTTSPVNGATSASYTTPALTATRSYWVRASNSAGSDNSSAATITVNPPVIAPIITNAPQSSSITSGGSATLSVVASGTSPTYQWYIGNSGVTTSPVGGATSASYTTPALTATRKYWVQAINSAGSDDSSAATITVIPPVIAPVITSHPVSSSVAIGGSVTLVVVATGTSPAFQWYAGNSGVTSQPVQGAVSASYVTPALAQPSSFWVRVANSAGASNSNTATVSISSPPPTTFANWVSNYSFPAAQAGWNDDPDKDGVVNSWEYFHGSHPLQASSKPTPIKLELLNSRNRITFLRARNIGGFTLSYLQTENLSEWTTIPATDLVSSMTVIGDLEEISLKFPRPPSPSMFYQLRLSIP